MINYKLVLTILVFNISLNAQFKKEKWNFSNPVIDLTHKTIVKPFGPNKRNPLVNDPVLISEPSPEKFEQFRLSLRGIHIQQLNDEGIPKIFTVDHLIVPREKNKVEYYSDVIKSTLGLESNYYNFEPVESDQDPYGTLHIKFCEKYKGIAIQNAEFTFHNYANSSVYASGYAWKIADEINVVPQLTKEQVFVQAKEFFKQKNITWADQNINNQIKSGIKKNNLVIWRNSLKNLWQLIYQVRVSPNLRENWELYVDANTGEIVRSFSNICNIAFDVPIQHHVAAPTGAETASALDLFNISKTINVWKEGTTYYMIDASRPMFNAGKSKFPANVFGTLITYDFKLKNIENSNSADFVTSSNNSWPSKTSVSAHLNAAIAYEYYRQTHNRNSIDGTGGNIISVINVNDGGGAMDNAFWNGEAMFYGNGKSAFTPLAKGIDVAGHEMSHGVIGSTANLNYEGESGAINESYADIFGAMIDRDDWKIGEDVVITSVFRSGALRDLSDPHNGGSSLNDNGYQPRHVNEQYKGTQDNGGVHINSGIPNYAFYNFVLEMSKSRSLEQAKQIGEKVYYYALTKFLTRSSNFKDLRVAIEKACTDLFGSLPDVLASAKIGFDRVGIGTSGTGGNTGNRVLSTNPGKEYIVCTDENKNGVYLYDFVNNPVLISNKQIVSKPSVTDNGQEIYFVGSDKRLYGLFLNPNKGVYDEQLLDTDPIYRNVSISKDGFLLSAVFDSPDKTIYIFDFDQQKWKSFVLYNPSYSNTVTGDVQYADVMDFDHSGEYVMYDASNVIKRSGSEDYEYWDVGFLHVFDNKSNGFSDGKIQKLVSSLPDNVTIGNPVFSKNSLDVIAFDYIEDNSIAYLVGSNIETNDFEAIISDRPVLSFPNYSVKDNKVIFDGENSLGDPSINSIGLNSTKIQASGNEVVVLNGGKWGSWFANGNRKLTINTSSPIKEQIMHLQENPVSEKLNLTIVGANLGRAELELTDLFGRVLMVKKLELTSGLNAICLDLKDIPNGNYILHLIDLKHRESVQFIKL